MVQFFLSGRWVLVPVLWSNLLALSSGLEVKGRTDNVTIIYGIS